MFAYPKATLVIASAAAFAAPAVGAPQSAQDRAAAIVVKMTTAEKLALIHGYFPPLAKPVPPVPMVPSAGYIPGIARLGIPALRESDASLGVANQVEQRKGDVATALPAGLATAASFDPELAYAGGAMIGAEARAKGFNVLLAGGVNLTRDPWNGRNFEYLGEDPLLAGTLAGEAIRGVQSNHIVSTVKHFVLNSQETGRMVLDARIAPPALRESDLLAFQLAIERGQPGSVMCAYNRVNGEYACENAALLTGVLKGDWGYRGWVMSDWGAVHSTDKAVMSGLDQESGQELDKIDYFAAPLERAIATGGIPAARLDDMTRRIVFGMVDTGLLDDPVPTTPHQIDYAAHAIVAQRVAEEGMVLLKNESGLLPFAATTKRIVLIGGHADVGVLSGGGSSQVRSVGGAPVEIPLESGAAASFARTTWHASSPLRALRAAFPEARITYVDGRSLAAAQTAARDADLAIVFATQWQTEAMDAAILALPDKQNALIDAVAAANKRTLVVLETGGPVLMPWLGRVSAVLQAWYPGQRGGEALARLLSGAVNPSGHLPITFPIRADDAPRPGPVGIAGIDADGRGAPFTVDYIEGADVGYRWYALKHRKPLFAFGFGLSYTTFRYDRIKINKMQVSFDVTNVGHTAGADVPQVYVEAAGSAGTKTFRLAGWTRVMLAPNETKHVTVALEPRTFARFGDKGDWSIAPDNYRLAVGHFAGDTALATTIHLPLIQSNQ
ncbi:beta-glucosidase [Polymorphobacter sp. PAMC 29334]|uniref:beta-glucosidase n=1 Tax=Polymorphobacter sp. PAMC 29334 TaxID=2862331 RepID=UPI001C667157|nr:beta-glucosidase [Polymorphobacter sp. PAMC 29334]QYE35654.1 beta-glucosidase [Polymorphobacter sp. PAMC 29334]